MTLNSSYMKAINSIHLITSYAEIYNMKTEILIQVGVCANCRFLVHSGTIHYAGGILKLLFHGIFWTEPLLDWTFLELNSFWTELFLSWTLSGLNFFWTELLLDWTFQGFPKLFSLQTPFTKLVVSRKDSSWHCPALTSWTLNYD